MRHEKHRQYDTFMNHARRFAEGVRSAFPHCPLGEEHVIALYSCSKGIGRVSLGPDAIQMAVAAFVRHRYTGYDARLRAYNDRDQARAEIRDAMKAILDQWRGGGAVAA